jgi:MinD superfamily P-loop ATPase
MASDKASSGTYRVVCHDCGIVRSDVSETNAESFMAEHWQLGCDAEYAQMMDTAGDRCTYCREKKPDCRPAAVVNRQFIPALCDACFRAICRGGRHDVVRDREVFYP